MENRQRELCWVSPHLPSVSCKVQNGFYVGLDPHWADSHCTCEWTCMHTHTNVNTDTQKTIGHYSRSSCIIPRKNRQCGKCLKHIGGVSSCPEENEFTHIHKSTLCPINNKALHTYSKTCSENEHIKRRIYPEVAEENKQQYSHQQNGVFVMFECVFFNILEERKHLINLLHLLNCTSWPIIQRTL